MDTADEPARARRAPSGARSGALIAAASFLATGLNYVFLLGAGRLLGSDEYGALAALLGLLTVVLLPTSALQLAVSREVSRRRAVGDVEGADAFGAATLRLSLIATAPIVAIALVLVIPLRELLSIGSTAAVALAMSGLVAALALPVALGVLQGYERFHAIAGLYVLPFALRLTLLAAIALAGLELGGVVFAAVTGGIAAAAVAVGLLREPLRRGVRAARPGLGPFFHYLWPVVVGLIGIAVLTNVDLLVVKARFTGDEAGEYAVASAFARIAFFLPATILAVLFPRTAARHARGEETEDILGRSLIVTAAFGSVLALFYAMTGRGLVHTSFGAEFADGGELLVLFTLSMTLFAVANVLVGFHLSRGETRYAWIVAGAVPVQIAVLALVPGSVRGVIWADLIIGTALLCAHELLVGSSVPALGAGIRHLSSGVRIARGTVLESVLVVLGFTAFVCVLFWPIATGLSSTVVASGSDALGGIWSLWRMQQEGGYHLFGTTHHALTGAPFGWDEGNGLNIQWLLPYYPTYLATKLVGEVAAFNLVLLSGYVLSGAAMYLLTRYLGCSRLVSAWAGLAYVVFPWHLERTPHPSLVHLELFPLLFLALIALAQRPSASRFALVGVATLGCWLTSGYFGAMAVVASVSFALGAAVISSRRGGAILVGGAAATAVAASLLVATLAMLAGTAPDAGLERTAGDLSAFGLRPVELVVPAADNLVLGDSLDSFWESRQHGSNPTETSNYLGLLTIGLVLAWLVVAWRTRKALPIRLRVATLGLVATGLAGLLLAAPSPVVVFGREIVMPSRLLFEVIPAFRVPSRWIPLVMAALVPLGALALQSAWNALRRPGRLQLAPVALVAAAMLVSLLELTVSPAEPLVRTDLPPEYEALTGTPPGILAEYPLVEDPDKLFWQREHGRSVLSSSSFGTPAGEARRVLVDPGAPGTPSTLALLGVTAIVTYSDAFDFVDGVPDVPNASWGPGYELVARTPSGSSVWRVTAPAAPALVTLTGGFADPLPPEDGVVAYPFVSPSGVGTLELTAKAPGVVRLYFDAAPPAGRRQVLRLADAEQERSVELAGRTPVSVLIEVPRGRSYVLVKTDPAATSLEDAVLLSAPRTETAAREPELRAVPISPEPGF